MKQTTIRTTLALAAGAAIGAAGMAASALEGGFLTDVTERGFTIHSMETAPESAKPVLEHATEAFGFTPNVLAIMAESPALLNSYMGTQTAIHDHGALSPQESNLVQLAIAVENECDYCTNAHAMAGEMMMGMDPTTISQAKMAGVVPDERLEALRAFSLSVYENRGRVTDGEIQAFLDVGFTRQQALDVVASISAKIMTNFTNQLAGTPLDEAFQSYKDSH